MSVLFNSMLLGAGDAGPNITFVANTTAAVSAANFVINKPAGVQVGDLMLMEIFSSSMTSNTTPSGWTVVSSDYVAGAGSRHVIYSRVVDGSEGSTFTVAGLAVAKEGYVVALRGASTVGTVGTVARATSATGTASSISPAVAGALIAIFASDDNRTVATPPAGMTQISTLSGTTGGSHAVYVLIPSSAGATGSKSLVWNISSGVASLLLQIN